MDSTDSQPITEREPAPVTRFIGLLAVAEMLAAEQIGLAAGAAPDFVIRRVLMDLLAERAVRYRRLVAMIEVGGDDPTAVMQSQQQPLVEFHSRTVASTWAEHLVKLIGGLGASHDLGIEAGPRAKGELGELVTGGESAGLESVLAEAVRDVLAEKPDELGRLSLWARRMSAEALTQAQAVVGNDEALAGFLAPRGEHGPDLAELTAVFARMLQHHNKRMVELGLTV